MSHLGEDLVHVCLPPLSPSLGSNLSSRGFQGKMGSHSQWSFVYTGLHWVELHIISPLSSDAGHHSWCPCFHSGIWTTLSSPTISPMVDLRTIFFLLFPFFSESNNTSQVFPQACPLISHPPLLPFCEALDKAFFFLGSFLGKPGIGLLCSGIPTCWLRHGSLTPGRWGVGVVQNPILSWFPLPFPPSL